MKKLFAVLILFSLPLAPVRAQGLHGKILIVRDSAYTSSDTIQSLLHKIYQGKVDALQAVPADLSPYDAVLLFPDISNYDLQDSLSVTEELNLIDFIKGGGRLYAESNLFLRFWNATFDPQDTLWHFLGLSQEGLDELEDGYISFFGVDSEFTRGLNVSNTNDHVEETYYPIGNFIPVLLGEEFGFGQDDVFAWIPDDTSIYAVMDHYPYPYFTSYYSAEYYAPFLTRVLCDYFGLCTDAVHESPPGKAALTMRVIYDGTRTDLQISGEEASEVDVSNALGVIVFRATAQAGTSLVELPATLPDGFYFARVESGSGTSVQSFAIFAR
jgi:hypothetical protein